jgi:glutathione reductase (NADPH)
MYDLFVIGGGSGGVRGARWAAARGAKVALCEDDRMGGTCVIRGCIPKKLMSYASHLPHEIETMEAYGWEKTNPKFDWNKLKTNRDKEIDRLSGIYLNILKNNNVDFFCGRGKIIEAHQDHVKVQVGEQVIEAKNILIATGGRATRPENVQGFEHGITSNEIFHLQNFPKKLVVVGTGYIGLEFASIFHGLGSEVHVMVRKDLPLSGFDSDVKQFVFEQMQESGIKFHCHNQVKEIIKNDSGEHTLNLQNGETIESVSEVLFATGRTPNIVNLFSDQVKVEIDDKQAIKVDAYSKTNVDRIFAVGDVTNRMNLTPVALEEAMYVVENLFENKDRKMTYENIATAVFSHPQVATCGLSEEEAKDKGLETEVYVSNFRGLKYTLTSLNTRTLMKMIVEKDSRKVVGLHMAGDDAGEMMQGLAVAIKAGATKEDFDLTIGIHPTAAEEWTTLRTPRK